ncbi:hypothetical protein F4821DRAFT_253784 [Hypoxylon rubiginosum]|uniref:Uncharacterized protein n=1 Tax=Hypoxylon rubiginosum TaxID=110542 RepID=A0ACC0DJV6_9PEZI|nr:hypothetical protein F4821DRAFT_253784 [Hypoxylon rubiginosum]
MPTIQQARRKTAQPSRAQIQTPNARPSSASKPSAPAQSHKPITTATRSAPTRSSSHNNTSAQAQAQNGRPLEAAAILSNPRLRQVTGLHPRKATWWNGVQPPLDELARLQWVMSLPDVYPVKRPKGHLRAGRPGMQH